METMNATTRAARRLGPLVSAIHEVTYSQIPHDGFAARGARNYWDGYFAGRAAPLGLAPAEVVHAAFYNFGPGEVARHIPFVWGLMTPEQALEVRLRGSTEALRAGLGELADSPAVLRAGELAERAAYSAPTEGRMLYAGLRALPAPEEPVARLWHAATLLREHRGDGHIVALVADGIGGLEAHMLLAIHLGMEPERFGRIHHLPPALLADVLHGLQERGLVDGEKRFTAAGRATRDRIEALTDTLAAPAYDVLSRAEVAELIACLEPLAAAVRAADL
ncbi:MarR family transcriptional regulator [Nocardioides sp.]|uniref:SCO6745 family protein n=1 Tax=Nocardioides sp. TaxID=35761 RepID=UPI0025D42596|nr:MarR family transcriptional regulator [Nocardioides sp.]